MKYRDHLVDLYLTALMSARAAEDLAEEMGLDRSLVMAPPREHEDYAGMSIRQIAETIVDHRIARLEKDRASVLETLHEILGFDPLERAGKTLPAIGTRYASGWAMIPIERLMPEFHFVVINGDEAEAMRKESDAEGFDPITGAVGPKWRAFQRVSYVMESAPRYLVGAHRSGRELVGDKKWRWNFAGHALCVVPVQ